MSSTEASEGSESNVKFPIAKTVKLTYEIVKELEFIAEYEGKDGVSALLRDWIIDRLHAYERNPHYLKKKRAHEEMLQKQLARERKRL